MSFNATQFLIDDGQKQQLDSLLINLNHEQLLWLSGYTAGLSQSKNGAKHTIENNVPSLTAQSEITILLGSRTGNGSLVAQKILENATPLGLKIKIKDLNDYQPSKIKEEKQVLIIVSTHGEGVPPLAAEDFYIYIHSKKAPNLSNLKFSVLALGDKSYVNFCKTGKDIDAQLEKLGAERIASRIDCDVDFWPNATSWIDEVLQKFVGRNDLKIELNGKHHPTAEAIGITYNKQNPFPAKLLERIKLNGKGSAKETYHIELGIENSGLKFEPGDALGVYATNSDKSVNELIDKLGLNPDELVEFENHSTTLFELLKSKFEITALSQDTIDRYNKLINNDELASLLSQPEKLKDYLYGRDVLDLFLDYQAKLSANELIGVLRKLQPRLYSISSSQLANPDEVHLTVAAVRYKNGRLKEGVCSNFLAERASDEDNIQIFVDKNPEFRLPQSLDTPIIMIGPGTGVAPYRSFLQQYEANGAKPKSWLFFGDRNFTTDFLYQSEWQQYLKKGFLTRMNVAFSRDTDKKVYVQHKMLEHSKELYRWIDSGANIYVCGDIKNMWKDVHATLIDIISKEGGISIEKATEYLQSLKKSRRYQVDVY
jgi:sulfite reductase (NADPH) flavoprotein alpha-component